MIEAMLFTGAVIVTLAALIALLWGAAWAVGSSIAWIERRYGVPGAFAITLIYLWLGASLVIYFGGGLK